MSEKKNDFLYLIYTAIICAVVVCVAFALRGFFPGQEISFTYGDYYAQFYPASVSFWRSVVEGRDLTFSFSNCMGLPTMAWYAYVAMSPVGILLYLIKDLETASFLVFMIKMIIASVLFWLFSVRVMKVSAKEAVYFSVAYALSAYSITFFVNIHYMDVLYIAPLLGICLMRFVKQKKMAGLILIYAFSFINMFLSGYSLGVFSAVALLAILWYQKTEKEKVIRLFIQYFCVVLSAVLLSMVAILPILTFVKMHMESGSTFSTIPLIDVLEIPVSYMMMPSNGTIFNTRPAIYCGWPILLLAILYFINNEIPKRERIAMAIPIFFLVICLLWKPVYLFMHAFDEPDSFAWRFSYLVVFVLATVADRSYVQLRRDRQIAVKKMTTLTGILLVTILTSVIYSNIKYGDHVASWFIVGANLLCIVLTAVVIVKGWSLAIYGIIELLVATYIMIPNFEGRSDFLQTSQKTELENIHNAVAMIKATEKDNEFYRININYGDTVNFSMLFDYRTMTFFSSLEDTNLWKTMYRLGYSARSQQITSFGTTEFTDMIFSVRYQMDFDETQNVIVTYNDKVLPPVFGVSEKILEYSGQYDPFENQNWLASAMTGEEIHLFLPTEAALIPGEGIHLVWDEDAQDYLAQKTGEDSTLIWIADTPENTKKYAYCVREKLSAALNEKNYLISGIPGFFGADTAIPFSTVCIMPMFEPEGSGQGVVTLYMTGEEGDSVRFRNMLCVSFDPEQLERVYQILLDGALQITNIGDKTIEGRIHIHPERTVLYTSIPYDPGWKVIVDGEEKVGFAVMDGSFLAVNLEPGEHNIRLEYQDEAFNMGVCCGLFGVVMLVCIFLLQKKQDSGNQKTMQEEK